MMKRIFALFAVMVFLAGCETASRGAGASGVSAEQQQLINVGNVVQFDFDSSALSSAARATLDSQVAYLNSNPNIRITVEGHCDERGTREYNLALGERRASAVRDYLVAQGIDGARVRTISYGKERPAVVGSNEGAWAQNRRAASVVR